MSEDELERLLNELNKEEREKFDYILNFYTRIHVYYNFEHFRKVLKDFKTFQVEQFTKPVDERLKQLLDKVEVGSIFNMLETLKTSFYNNPENKSVTDLLLYLTTYADVKEKTRLKIIENVPKYKRIVETGAITAEEILNVITKKFEQEMNMQERLDLGRIQNSINYELYEMIKNKDQRIEYEKDLYEGRPTLFLSEDLLKGLDKKSINEAFEKDRNVVTKNMSILAIKVILGDKFETADDVLIERLKAMLTRFDITKMTAEDINIFRDNIDKIIQKEFNVEDLFFIKNISSNEDALIAYKQLPEELRKQVLLLNIIAKKGEIANVLDALAFIRDDKKKEEIHHNSASLDERITFGIELELDGITPETLKALKENRELYKSFRLKYGLDTGFYDWKIEADGTVPNGVELISYTMRDSEKSWNSLSEVCTAMNALNASVGATCGGHIHIGASILGTDQKAWENLFNIWRVAEPIIYKVSNKEKEEARRGTLKEASPVASIIDDMFQKGIVKIENLQDVTNLATEYTRRFIKDETHSGRCKAMNLQCIAEGKQNTIEFRIPNSSLDFAELKNNIKLFAKIVEVSKKMSEDKEYKQDSFERLMTSRNEEDKMKALMDLLFDNISDKEVFYRRYYSREENLEINGKKYSDLQNKTVEVNQNERYNWRGFR